MCCDIAARYVCCEYNLKYYEPGHDVPWAACINPKVEVCCPGPCAGCRCESDGLCNNGGAFPPTMCSPAC